MREPGQRFFGFVPKAGLRLRMTAEAVILSPAAFFPPERRISGCGSSGMEYAAG
jgi:hypothetical protein